MLKTALQLYKFKSNDFKAFRLSFWYLVDRCFNISNRLLLQFFLRSFICLYLSQYISKHNRSQILQWCFLYSVFINYSISESNKHDVIILLLMILILTTVILLELLLNGQTNEDFVYFKLPYLHSNHEVIQLLFYT